MKQLLLIGGIALSMATYAQHESDTIPHHEEAPIPVEAMVGNKWAMFQTIITKDFANRKVNFFNLINYEVDYDPNVPQSYIIQSVFSYNINRFFSVGTGANLKAFGGFKPLIAGRFSMFNRNVGLVIQPSIELHKNGVSEVFALFEWNPFNAGLVSPFFGIQGATNITTRNGEHDFSYINARLGVQVAQFRLGPALNSRFVGPTGNIEMNYGGFISISIF
ncbi:MAG: hypothetical protein MI810_05145 [Flavobacteriales bacterium]|nr:hypothetical protein [Flavobacteriales bacterium]